MPNLSEQPDDFFQAIADSAEFVLNQLDTTGHIDRAKMAELVVMFNEYFKEGRTHGVVDHRLKDSECEKNQYGFCFA